MVAIEFSVSAKDEYGETTMEGGGNPTDGQLFHP